MDIEGRCVLVTGAASGIGLALARRFAAGGAAGVCMVDIDGDGLQPFASELGAFPIAADVSDESQATAVCMQALKHFGRIDILCSNAGIHIAGGPEISTEDWNRIWKVNVFAHELLVRNLLPPMLDRGEGYIVGTVSAAGLVNDIASIAYGVTKGAALAFFEWLSISYGDRGIGVSALCPMGVRTRMFRESGGEQSFLAATAVEPEQVADEVVDGMAEGRFLILPHPEVAEFFRRKGDDYDRWIRGMRRLRAAAIPAT